jgi:dTDP-4-amino-4,6-dideoxygalactose transaminase
MKKHHISFNKPFLTGKEVSYIREAVYSGKISGNGLFTQKCQTFFERKYHIRKCLLTTSCTDALEMCALLLDIKEGDEVIMPSFTFVSTANAFVLRGAKIIFSDSGRENPNINPSEIEQLISPKTKAIVVVHYAGMACDLDKIVAIADKHGLYVIEDAAQAIDSYYKGKALGSIGHLSAFSFHETKNIISGEGGMLAINDEKFIKRAEIIWEKGTNRAAFWRGEVDKYGWVDIGSSFLPSEIVAAFLYAQLENMEKIQKKRKTIWDTYYKLLRPIEEKGLVRLPQVPQYSTNNGHIFYIICNSENERSGLIKHLKNQYIDAVFHYQSLHKSVYYKDKHDKRELPWCDYYADRLVRLPLHYDLKMAEIKKVAEVIVNFYSL